MMQKRLLVMTLHEVGC